MDGYKKELKDLQFKIDTDEKLISNLYKKGRWEVSLSGYDAEFEKLTGD